MNLPTRHDVLRPLAAAGTGVAALFGRASTSAGTLSWRTPAVRLAALAVAVVAVFCLVLSLASGPDPVVATAKGAPASSTPASSTPASPAPASPASAAHAKVTKTAGAPTKAAKNDRTAAKKTKPRVMFTPPPQYANPKLDRPRCAQATEAVVRLTRGTTVGKVGPEVAQVVDEQSQVLASSCGPVTAARINSRYLTPFYG